MKKQLLAGVAVTSLSLASGMAFAADMPVKAAPAPVYGCYWNGLYVGGHVGYGENRAKGSYFGDSDTIGFRQGPRGVLGGVQVGQNWCQNTFIYGWEGDVSFMNLKQVYRHSSEDDSLTNKMNLLASLRVNLGTTIDPNTMVFLTGGPAYMRGSATFFEADTPTTIKSDFNKFGGVVGVGLNSALTANWFWSMEALYYFFNAKKSFDDGTDAAVDKLNSAWVLRLGLNYKFGDSGKAPVAAMPTKAPAYAAAMFDWSGLYVGGDVGWQGSRIGLSAPGDPVTYRPIHDSVAAGGHVGAQAQFDRLVLGVEGGYISGFDHANWTATGVSIFTSGGESNAEAKFKDAWSVGGRAGWSMGRWMPYLTAGWAEGRFGFHAQDTGGGSSQAANVKTNGAYFGGGVDFALGNNWVFGVEYRFYDFKAKETVASNSVTVRFAPDTETIMARLSYKFDWGSKGPVVAKY